MAKEHYIPEGSGQNMKNIATNKDTYHQAAGLLTSTLRILSQSLRNISNF